MDADEIMKLFDSCWFELGVFKKHPKIESFSCFDRNPDREIEEETRISKLPSLHTRSMSDGDRLSSFRSELLSPDSVLPRLHTILSGKEVAGDQNDVAEIKTTKETKEVRMRRKRGETKSLSDLEFEELKGFMDLGFVFSEEDKDSSLASIIPGLQRLGKKENDEEEGTECSVSRPYLSEAWEVPESPLMNWRVPSLRNETAVKDNLKWWAHAVASIVR